MSDAVTLSDLQNHIARLQSTFRDEIVDGFNSVVASPEGKSLLVQIYTASLTSLLAKIQRPLNTDLDIDTLQAYLNDLEQFVLELRAAIQYPHRIKVGKDLERWLSNWSSSEKVEWDAFLSDCTEADLNKLDEALQNLAEVQFSEAKVKEKFQNWIALQVIDLSKFEKNVNSLLDWLDSIHVNLNDGLRLEKELVEIQSKVNAPDWASIGFLSLTWLQDVKKRLLDSNPVRDWAAETTKEALITEWAEIQNRLITIRPMLGSLNSTELDLLRRNFQYSVTSQWLDILSGELRKFLTYKPNLDKQELQSGDRKLASSGYKRINDLIENSPAKMITIDQQTTFSSLVSQYVKATQKVPEWLEQFQADKEFLTRKARNWSFICGDQFGPKPDEEIQRVLSLCNNVQSLGDLIDAHNALQLAEIRIKKELEGSLSSLEADLFDRLTQKAAADDKHINLGSLPVEDDQVVISLARKNLIDVFIRV